MIYTFYSFKGGVGRTMALANLAELLYLEGKKVLMVDWDLEAPGLERFFPEIPTLTVINTPGVIDMLLDYKKRITQQSPDPLDFTPFLIDIYPKPANKRGGKLWLLTAGQRSHFPKYVGSVQTFDWQDFYENWKGELYLEWMRQEFLKKADIVLIDSRTGVTEMGGVCTYQLADTVIMFCAPNQQNLDGTERMALNFIDAKVQELRPKRPLNVLIVPARIEQGEGDLLDEFKTEFDKKEFAKLDKVELLLAEPTGFGIPYVPKYAFKEIVAIREREKPSAGGMVKAFESIKGEILKREILQRDIHKHDIEKLFFADADTWLQSFGFKPGLSPFDEVVAEREKDLGHYFIEFPYFYEIRKPKTTFLYLDRGAGKSANCLMLKKECDNSLRGEISNLAIMHTDFYNLIDKADVTQADHVESILRQAVPRLYEIATSDHERAKLVKELLPNDQDDFVWFLLRYSNCLSESTLKKQIARISEQEGWSEEQTKNIIIKVAGLATRTLGQVAKIDSSVNAITALLETKAQKASADVTIATQNRYPSPLETARRFGEIAQNLNIQYIYILIDRVDEFTNITDFTKAANMLEPLVQAIPLLEMDPFAFKFFLPTGVRADLSWHYREDRFPPITYIWQTKDLRDLLERRLEFCCDPNEVPNENERRSFTRLFAPDARTGITQADMVEELITFANGSPRTLIRLAKKIFEEHLRLPPFQQFISKETYQKVLNEFKSN